MIAALAFVLGSLNGSYFKIAAFDDQKIINHPLFRIVFVAAVFASLLLLGYTFFLQASFASVPPLNLRLADVSVGFLVYSTFYFIAHSLCVTSDQEGSRTS